MPGDVLAGIWPLAVIDGVKVAPCLGSGFCCKETRCSVGVAAHGPGANCPSLVWEHGRYWCGQILRADSARAAQLRSHLYIGAGCCSSLNRDRLVVLKGGRPAERISAGDLNVG